MKKDITVCIGTVGYPTFERCLKRVNEVAEADGRIKKVVVIKNKYPTSAWLNEMRYSCKTTWCLQIDEDMYLHDNAIDELIKLAQKSEAKGIKVLNASGLLLDLFLNTNIGSLKLWNTEAFKVAEFKDVKGSDRQFAKDAGKFGFRNVEVHKVLGKHDSAPNPEIAFFKYKEYVEKIKRFEGEQGARRFVRHLKSIRKKRKDVIGDYAFAGGYIGLRSSGEDNTKNYLDNIIDEPLLKRINEIIK